MELKPLYDRIIVLRAPKPPHPSGIYIPDVATERSDKGRVLAVGSTVEDVKVGDMVLFVKYSGTEVKVEGVPMLVMTEKEIIAIIEETADVEPT